MQCIQNKQTESASPARPILFVALSILVISFILKPDSLPKIELCLFHAVTSLSCPGCGMTRAFCAISHGQFEYAWQLNPFSFNFYALTVSGLAYPFFANTIVEKTIRIFAFVTIAAMAAFGVYRILTELALF